MSSVPEAPSGTFSSLYALGEELGRGSFAVVHKCTNKKSGKQYAVKVVTKKSASTTQLRGQRRSGAALVRVEK